MKTVSTSFAPFADSRVVDFNVRFELLDTNAQGAATPSTSGAEACSQLSQLTDDITSMSEKYASLEPGLWRLGGGFKIIPDSVTGKQTGWWSNVLSGADGVFETAPWLLFSFGSTAISTVGFTMAYDDKANQFPTQVKITTYGSDGTTVIAQDTFDVSGAHQIIEFACENYYSVKFEFLKTSEPCRRIRLCNVVFGIVQTFDKDSLQSVNIKAGADVAAEAFQTSEMAFVFDNADHKYNLINPNGLYAYLQQGQQLITTAIIGGESVETGKFAFTKAEASDDELTATITANDYALALDGAQYNSGSNTTSTLAAALTAVLSGTGITFTTTAGSTTVSMAIPVGTTKREALRLLAQAACCSIWFDRDRVLHVEPLTVSETADDELTADRMPSLGGIRVSEPVGQVVLTVRNEFADTENTYTSGTGTPVKTVANPCVANGQTVADWLYAQFNRRVRYEKPNRCNPAVEVGDTLNIADAYGENNNAVVTEISIKYDGGLSATTKAVGN